MLIKYLRRLFSKSSIDKILVSVVGMAAVVALGFFIYMELGSRSEPDPAADYPVFTLMGEMTNVQFLAWVGTISCGPEANWGPFSREITLWTSNSVLALERGNVSGFLQATQRGEDIPETLRQRFEFWRGRISGNKVSVDGWYTEGAATVKHVSMRGGLTGERLLLEGQRGPRRCRVEAIPADRE